MAKSGPKPKTIEERFWPKVEKTAGCWNWTGGKLPKGYGVIGRGGRGNGSTYAHRVAYELLVGPIGTDHIHHECGNPSCVNPEHLRALPIRTHNRISSHAKLNPDAAALIRDSDRSNAELARAFRVDPSVISRIRSGKAWT